MKPKTDKHVGFWRSDYEPELPRPRPHDKPMPDQGDFLLALRAREREAQEVAYRGYSSCRLCELRRNGTREYRHESGWIWPQGYAHYIEAHNVRPPEAFHQFVLEVFS